MREIITHAVSLAITLDEVRNGLIEVLGFTRRRSDKLGYAAGVITSDGPERQAANIARLIGWTDRLREQYDFPIFSATDVFSDEVFERIEATRYPQLAWLDFWRVVLGSSHVTDIFMTPGWRRSKGATDEHETAEKNNIRIHDLDESWDY